MQVSRLIFKNFLWRGFFYGTSLVLNIAMARMLGAELSGGLYFFLTNIYLVLLIGSFSLDAGITYYVSKNEYPADRIASFALVWSGLVSVLVAVLFLFFYHNNSDIFQSYFLLFASLFYSLGTFLSVYFTAFFYSKDDYQTPNLITGLFNLLLLACVLFQFIRPGIINEKLFLEIFFIAAILQGIFIAVSWLVIERTSFILNTKSVKLILPVMRYSFAALAGNLAYFILYRVDYWFVEYYCTAKSLGNYIQVSRLGQLLILPSAIIAGTLFPQASKENISFQAISFGKLARTIIPLYLLTAVMILLTGRPLILFLWGIEFNEMYEPLVIIMPGIIFLAVSYLFSPIFAGKGKVNYNVFISLVTLLVVIICNFLFVPPWGIKGAAFATSAGFMVMMILYIIIAKRKFGFTLKLFSGTS